MALASHYGQGRVAVIEPADELNPSSVNAFLKTIEEPPAGTQLLLVSEQPGLLKPTLRSRCQRVLFGVPEPATAAEWLAEQGVAKAAELLAGARGAPLLALSWQRSGRFAQHQQWQDWLQGLAEQRSDPLTVAADVGKADAAEFLTWLSGWLGILMSQRLAAGAAAAGLSRFCAAVVESQRRIEGNAKAELVLEALLIQWWSLHRTRRTAGAG